MKKVITYVHTHWDREWYREFEEFRLRLIEVFDEVLDMLKTAELPCFYFDGQTAALEDYLEIRPEKLIEIKSLIKQKKLRIGPFYCSADSFLVSGECLYKNFEIGINKSKEFGETEFIGYLADTFGHSKCIPYILKAHNIDKACIWRGAGDISADLDWDGIKLTNLVQGYFQDFLNAEHLCIEKKAEYLKKYLDKISMKSNDYILLPIGADHLGVVKSIAKQIKELNKIYKDYEITLAMPFEYYEKIKNRQKVCGEFLDNSLTFILPGVYSTRIYTKQANAKSQWLLTNIAEPLQALGNYFYDAKNKQKEIDYAYKLLIKNHAHDSIYGCNIDSVQQEVMQRFKKVDTVSNGVIKRTIRDLTDKDGDLSLINLSNNEYTGIVRVLTHKRLPEWMKAVKISSYKGFTDEKLYNINDIPVTEDITDINEYLISVKGLKPYSLTKVTEENILRTFIKITDRADIGDSYNFGPLLGDKECFAKVISYKLKEKNEKRAVLQVKYEINIPISSNYKGRSKRRSKTILNCYITLYTNLEFIEFNIEWENKSKNHILQVGFKLNDKITKTINEDLYGTTERYFNPDFNIYKCIPAKKGIEIKPNTSVMQRFVNVQDFALIVKGNCEYEVNGEYINLTLLRAVGIISNPNNPSRGTPAGPPLETPQMQCLGKNIANFAIAFTDSEIDLYRLSDDFFGHVIPIFTNKKDKQFIKADNKNIRITAIHNTDKGLRLRIFNNSNKMQNVEIKLNQKENVKILPHEIKNIDFPLYSR